MSQNNLNINELCLNYEILTVNVENVLDNEKIVDDTNTNTNDNSVENAVTENNVAKVDNTDENVTEDENVTDVTNEKAENATDVVENTNENADENATDVVENKNEKAENATDASDASDVADVTDVTDVADVVENEDENEEDEAVYVLVIDSDKPVSYSFNPKDIHQKAEEIIQELTVKYMDIGNVYVSKTMEEDSEDSSYTLSYMSKNLVFQSEKVLNVIHVYKIYQD